MASTGAGHWDPDMRASDADRERLVEQLREHHAAGRLTLDEFEERMRQAYDSKTYGELRVLTRDLPVDLAQLTGPGTVRQQRPIEVQRGPAGFRMQVDHQALHDMRQAQREAWMARRGGRGALGLQGWVALSVLLTGIWLIANIAGGGNWDHFWPIWPIGVVGLLTLTRRIRG
jgi:hypothetical protein